MAYPPRIIHLLGGLRVVDLRQAKITLELGSGVIIGELPTPQYSAIYGVLEKQGLTPIGVEFVSQLSLTARVPPDWYSFYPRRGFLLKDERQEWSNVRHHANQTEDHQLEELASRCVTYLDLLEIRLIDLSHAYNSTLAAAWDGPQCYELQISNGFVRQIDACLHAYLSDAASFRDLISEIMWLYVLNEAPKIRKYEKFIRANKSSDHDLVKEWVKVGCKRHWLRQFGDLRNEVVHVAPMGSAPAFHFCKIKKCQLTKKGSFPNLHYAVLDADGEVWKGVGQGLRFHPDNEAAIKSAVEIYDAYLDRSLDALKYVWETNSKFIDFLSKARVAAELKGEMATITDDDILDAVVFTPNDEAEES